MKKSTAELALEALDNLTMACLMVDAEGDLDSRIGGELLDAATSAIDAMRAELAQPVEPVNADASPRWSATAEAMLWLNQVELVQGGANGPTIKLRAAILALDASKKAGAQSVDLPVAWIRFCSDGCYEGPIMHRQMEEVRKASGAWTPLYAAPQEPAGWQLVPIEPTLEMVEAARWEDGGATARAVYSYMLKAAPKATP